MVKVCQACRLSASSGRRLLGGCTFEYWVLGLPYTADLLVVGHSFTVISTTSVVRVHTLCPSSKASQKIHIFQVPGYLLEEMGRKTLRYNQQCGEDPDVVLFQQGMSMDMSHEAGPHIEDICLQICPIRPLPWPQFTSASFPFPFEQIPARVRRPRA
jgi:hypothetical protein